MSAQDRLRVEGMEFHGSVGVSAAERALITPITVDLELRADLARAGVSDDLRDSVDYSVLHTEMTAIAEGGSFHLLEALAEALAAGALAHEVIDSVEVRVAKRPALAGHVTAAAVFIERSRGDGA